jgi:hydroxymethylpyrimidine/phosphomethylpyrimidine kinase
MHTYRRTLSIAGSDPSGGAGIQADLKTMSALGCYAASAITAVVDENTQGVYGVHVIPASFLKGQIASVLSDIGADAVKIGMLPTVDAMRAVRESLVEFGPSNVVLDPVMVATSGDSLMEDEGLEYLRRELLPLARVITPNLPEAERLLGKKIEEKDFADAAQALSHLCEREGARVSVLLKAGHLDGDTLTDLFYNAESHQIVELSSPRIPTENTHGTGCTLSSAVASFLAYGQPLNDAVRLSKDFITKAIANGAHYQIGKGHGPVHHFFNFWL